jgi:hypothetical protein
MGINGEFHVCKDNTLSQTNTIKKIAVLRIRFSGIDKRGGPERIRLDG